MALGTTNRQMALSIDFIPLPAILINDFDKLGLDIRSFREPLKRSIQEVVGPSMHENFAVGGRPPWEPLHERTVDDKAAGGYPEDILVRSGDLAQVAGQLNLWTIDGPGGEARSTGLPERVHYGIFHQSGTRFMPQREWAVIQEEDIDRIVEVFDEWLGERLTSAGFG